jgi:hypothetical protein
MQRKALEKASPSVGAPFGNLKGGSFIEDFERRKKEFSKTDRLYVYFSYGPIQLTL